MHVYRINNVSVAVYFSLLTYEILLKTVIKYLHWSNCTTIAMLYHGTTATAIRTILIRFTRTYSCLFMYRIDIDVAYYRYIDVDIDVSYYRYIDIDGSYYSMTPLIIERTIGLVLGPSTALYRPFLKHCALTKRRLVLYDGSCPNLLRSDKVLIFVPSDCKSGLLQPSDLSSLPDGRSIACPIQMSIYIFLICNIYHLCCTFIDFYDLSAVTVGLLSILGGLFANF